MQPATENKIVLVVKPTRLDELIVRFNTEMQARFYVESLGADFSDYQQEDQTYKLALRNARLLLTALGRVQTVDVRFVPNFIFGAGDTVVALGQDGLVANVLKYLNGQVLLGVNPDRKRYEGVLLPFQVEQLPKALQRVFAGNSPLRSVTMAQVRLNNGQQLYAVNDLFIGPKTHTSARYVLEIGGQRENHSSSGIIVSTGLGSSGWLRSVLTGSLGIAAQLAGQATPPRPPELPWDADYLYFSVREPWPSKASSANITFGKVTADTPLQLLSQMPQHGVIFSDGIEADFLEFNAGTLATITVANKQGLLAVH